MNIPITQLLNQIKMDNVLLKYKSVPATEVRQWVPVALVEQFPDNGGRCFKHEGMQIAIFQMKRIGKWYACQNLCPHKMEMVLSRGMVGDDAGVPKVACPLHKKTFSLEDGTNLNGDLEAIATYPVDIREGMVYVGL